MGNNRFMVVSEEKDIIAMNPSYIEQKGKSLIIYMPGTYKQLELEYKTEENAIVLGLSTISPDNGYSTAGIRQEDILTARR